MLNKIHCNVQQMLAEARQIITQHGYSPHHKRIRTIDSTTEPRQSFLSSKILQKAEHKNKINKRQRANTHNDNHSQQKNILGRRTITESHREFLKYSLRPQSISNNILMLQPSERELLSTKIFGVNKLRSFKREGKINFPKIKRKQNSESAIRIQYNVLEPQPFVAFTDDIRKQRKQSPMIRSIELEQNIFIYKNRRKNQNMKFTAGLMDSRKKLLRNERQLKQASNLQPWRFQHDDAEQINR